MTPGDTFIEIDFVDSQGVVVEQSIDSVSFLRPGDTAQWDARAFTRDRFADCRARVSSVFEQ